jgi:hypothetical protein
MQQLGNVVWPKSRPPHYKAFSCQEYCNRLHILVCRHGLRGPVLVQIFSSPTISAVPLPKLCTPSEIRSLSRCECGGEVSSIYRLRANLLIVASPRLAFGWGARMDKTEYHEPGSWNRGISPSLRLCVTNRTSTWGTWNWSPMCPQTGLPMREILEISP